MPLFPLYLKRRLPVPCPTSSKRGLPPVDISVIGENIMRLVEVHIHNFRCIEDSEKFSVDQVTCLVGKNESGKTALLKAIHKLKPENKEIELFEPSRDYPKRKWRPDVPIPADQPAIETLWTLDDSEIKSLEGKYGVGTIKSNKFRLSKGYENNRIYDIQIDEQALIKHLILEAECNSTEKKPLAGAKNIRDLQKGLEGIAQRSPNQEKLYQRIINEYKSDAYQAIANVFDEMVPTFLYFDQYLRLPGTVSVNELLKRKAENRLDDGDRIFNALLGLAGATIESIHEAKTFEEFNSSLQAVSNQISDQIFKYWSQNRHLNVIMRLDSARPNDLAPFNLGSIFRTRIYNSRHKADTSFDERSSGFVWFFSFLVWFNRLKDTYGQNLIILLDEPGLSLHARAQADLLRYINEQLKPTYQVIYTTHSPFMIDPDNLLSARTVEDVVKKNPSTGEEDLIGTKVSENVLSTDPDTISPLQKALDYEITQTLFIGRHTLLVEGPSDLLYLKWFSKKLQEAGKLGLDYRWSISLVGGIDRIPGFVSIFRGNQLHIAALVDVQSRQKQKIDNARKALGDRNLLLNSIYSEQNEADIEDVLGAKFYVALVNMVYELSVDNQVKTPTQESSNRVVPVIEEHFRNLPSYVGEFNHFTPAERLFQGKVEGQILPGYNEAMSRMEKLISDINALLS